MIDLNLGKLTRQDLGQMQMYVNLGFKESSQHQSFKPRILIL